MFISPVGITNTFVTFRLHQSFALINNWIIRKLVFPLAAIQHGTANNNKLSKVFVPNILSIWLTYEAAMNCNYYIDGWSLELFEQ